MSIAPQPGIASIAGGNVIRRGENVMMNGFGSEWGLRFGWLWMIVIVILTGFAIATLIKYFQK